MIVLVFLLGFIIGFGLYKLIEFISITKKEIMKPSDNDEDDFYGGFI